MDFAKPSDASSDQFNAKDHPDKLVMFVGHRKDIYDGTWGPVDIAVCELIAVIGDKASEEPLLYRDAWVFGKRLAPQVFNSDGPVLGRLTKGEAKKGQNAPWVLEDPTAKDLKLAKAFAAQFLDEDGKVRWVADYGPDEAPF